MRIGVMTFFESDNYGTVLQAYALQTYLEKLGHSVQLIQLKRNVHAKGDQREGKKENPSFSKRFRGMVVRKIHDHDDERKKQNFATFRRDFLHITEKLYPDGDALAEDLEQFDLIISGGDQIWNPYHKVFSYDYMCHFLPSDFKRISYGSSFGIEKIGDQNILLQMKDQLAKYHALLVREESGVTILHSMGLRAEQVVDPVLLDKSLWNKFITPDSPFKGTYGVIYALVDYPDSDDAIIRSYAKAKGLKLVILPENRRNCMTTYRKRFSLSPQEFVNYIAHCEVVFTNSFHGMVFGLLMGKKIVMLNTCTEEARKKNVRLTDMLQRFDVQNCELEHLKQEFSCDYEKVSAAVVESRKLLEAAIAGGMIENDGNTTEKT